MLACFLLSSRAWLGWLLAAMSLWDHSQAPRKATSWWYVVSPRENPSCPCPGHTLSQLKSPIPCLLPHFEAPILLGGSWASCIGICFCPFLAVRALKPSGICSRPNASFLSLCPSSCNWIHFFHPAHPRLLPIPLRNDAGSGLWQAPVFRAWPAATETSGGVCTNSYCTLDPTVVQQPFSFAVPAPFPFAASFSFPHATRAPSNLCIACAVVAPLHEPPEHVVLRHKRRGKCNSPAQMSKAMAGSSGEMIDFSTPFINIYSP